MTNVILARLATPLIIGGRMTNVNLARPTISLIIGARMTNVVLAPIVPQQNSQTAYIETDKKKQLSTELLDDVVKE